MPVYSLSQYALSSKLEDLKYPSTADKACLFSIYTASWLLVTPSEGLGLQLDPNESNVAIKWWLGSKCVLCTNSYFDTLGHHAACSDMYTTCTSHHNKRKEILVESFHCAHLSVRVKIGSN